MGIPEGSAGKESACSARAPGDVSSIPELGTCSGGGHGIPFLYSCLVNSMDRGVWQTTVHEVTKLGTTDHMAQNYL